MERICFWLLDRLADLVRLLWRLAGAVVFFHLCVLLFMVPLFGTMTGAVAGLGYGLVNVPWPYKALVPPAVATAAVASLWTSISVFEAACRAHAAVWGDD